MGSENFKFKVQNVNEDLIFKNEDEMYKLDMQIEMFDKCKKIIEGEIIIFDRSNPGTYEFPKQKLRPMMFFWEKKYQDALFHFFMNKKPMQRESLETMKIGLSGKLLELQNLKAAQLSNFEDVYKKNFIKSLDHRSFQYKEFIKKIQQKQQHLQEIKTIALNN